MHFSVAVAAPCSALERAGPTASGSRVGVHRRDERQNGWSAGLDPPTDPLQASIAESSSGGWERQAKVRIA
jgi:hypothetical protein